MASKPPTATSTTARLAWATLVLLLLCLATIWLLAFIPSVPAEAWSTLATISLAIAGGGAVGTAAYGARHVKPGQPAPTIPASEP